MKKIYFFIGLLCIFLAISNQYTDVKMAMLDIRPLVVGRIDSLFVKEKNLENVSCKQHWVKFSEHEPGYLVCDFSKNGEEAQFAKGEFAILMKCVLSSERGVEKEYRMFSSHQSAKKYYSLGKKNEDFRNSYLLAILGVVFLVAACFTEYYQFRKNRKNC